MRYIRPLPCGRALAYSSRACRAARRRGIRITPGTERHKAADSMLMPAMTKGSPFVRVGLSAPAIALVYAAVAYTFVTLGCMPLFSDVDFFGVRVTMFLLAALTGAALVLI